MCEWTLIDFGSFFFALVLARSVCVCVFCLLSSVNCWLAMGSDCNENLLWIMVIRYWWCSSTSNVEPKVKVFNLLDVWFNEWERRMRGLEKWLLPQSVSQSVWLAGTSSRLWTVPSSRTTVISVMNIWSCTRAQTHHVDDRVFDRGPTRTSNLPQVQWTVHGHATICMLV